MKIIHLIQRIGHYHSFRFGLLSKIYDLHVYVLNPGLSSHPWVSASDITVPYTTISLPTSLIPRIFSYVNLFFDLFSADLVLLPGYHKPLYQLIIFLSSLFGLPLVVCCDSTHVDRQHNILSELYKKILLSSVKCFFVASTLSESFVRQYSPHCFCSSPLNIVDNLAYAKQSSSASLSDYFLVVARNDSCKNYHNLLVAYDLYLRSGGRSRLVIAGFMPSNCFYLQFPFMYKHRNFISVHGFLDLSALLPLYHSAKALVLYSISEPWGLVVNEAIASSLFCIVSNKCGVTSSLALDQNTCLVVDPLDPNSLLQSFKFVDSTSRHELDAYRSRALSLLHKSFSGQAYTAAIMDFIEFYSS